MERTGGWSLSVGLIILIGRGDSANMGGKAEVMLAKTLETGEAVVAVTLDTGFEI